jgi:preprotein translocase subunit SecF
MDFMRFKWLYFLISAVVILPGLYSLLRFGLKPGIDFTGGAAIEVQSPRLRQGFGGQAKFKIQEIVNKIEGTNLSSIQESGEENLILKLKPIDQTKKDEILKAINQEFPDTKELRFETVGPILGQELIKKTIVAVILATGFILFYLAWQFHDKRFGICATLATFHDSLVILGIFSLLGHFKGVEIDTLFVTAVLTSLSFSVHDTVVVYDRIRESMKNFPKAKFVDLVNKAITETMSRSLNNSLTIIFMLTVLWLIGGETIKWFVFALLVGTISGTYSSPFVATPLLVVWRQIQEKRKK